ncbi:MAG: hypothetical protein V2J08_08195 [Desulfotignum sp.]|jgi:hypothetical protein|nr:hypothetical protein [Desulfotignum sp.]
MDAITLMPDGWIYKKDKKMAADILPLLSNTICLEKRVTLGSFFNMVKKYPDLIRLSDYLEPLLNIAAAAGENAYPTEDIQKLVFYKTIAMKGFPGTPRVEIYNSLKGIQNEKKMLLKFFSVETLVNHELTLGKLEHVIFGDGQDMFTYDTYYSLFELVEGIAWDLSFCFNPIQCTLRR